jgi:16S rRNA (guanine966-N2)-methyltransferase
LRIIGGKAGGRKLVTPHGRKIRPTSDRIKEALFSILTSLLGSFADLKVLDIFAGTGNLGIEALSRGASRAIFIDNGRDAVQIIGRNLSLLGFSSQAVVMAKDVSMALNMLDITGEQFDLVIIDPPYARGLAEHTLMQLANSRLLADDALVVAETSAREELPPEYGQLRIFDRRVYGDTALAFLR